MFIASYKLTNNLKEQIRENNEVDISYLGVWQKKNIATVDTRTRDILMSFDC